MQIANIVDGMITIEPVQQIINGIFAGIASVG